MHKDSSGGDYLNARQKVKKLKKELEALKTDKTNGFKWLKIDGLSVKREEPRLWYDNTPMHIRAYPITYVIQIGHTIAEIMLEDPEDKLIVIDSKKLDEAIQERMKER